MTPPPPLWGLVRLLGSIRGGGLKRKGVSGLNNYTKTLAHYQLYFSFFCMVSKSLNAATIDTGHLSINCSTSDSVFFRLTLFIATNDFKILMSQGVFQGNKAIITV